MSDCKYRRHKANMLTRLTETYCDVHGTRLTDAIKKDRFCPECGVQLYVMMRKCNASMFGCKQFEDHFEGNYWKLLKEEPTVETCKFFMDHDVVWAGDGYFCSKCMTPFLPKYIIDSKA